MVVVEFDPASYNVSESGGSVTLTIVKRGVIGRPLQVEFSTADGTAIGNTIHCYTCTSSDLGITISHFFVLKLHCVVMKMYVAKLIWFLHIS